MCADQIADEQGYHHGINGVWTVYLVPSSSVVSSSAACASKMLVVVLPMSPDFFVTDVPGCSAQVHGFPCRIG
jgi:hypothetical protein